jgi:hypothetical protein
MITLLFDTQLMRPGCVLLQAAAITKQKRIENVATNRSVIGSGVSVASSENVQRGTSEG